MAFRIRRADYYYVTLPDEPGHSYRLLSQLAELGINLLAFTGVPINPIRTQLTIFPEDPRKLESAAKKAGFDLEGPHRALLVQGDDELGALASIHDKLDRANVTVYASSGVTDGVGSFGYVLYVRPEDYERAVDALEV
jgi:hypothetical protein